MLYSTDLLLIYAKVQINFDSTKRYRTFDLKNHRNDQSFFSLDGNKPSYPSFQRWVTQMFVSIPRKEWQEGFCKLEPSFSLKCLNLFGISLVFLYFCTQKPVK